MIRKTIFWLHLITGVAIGLVVAMMSFTGVLLTYEHQLIAGADREFFSTPEPGAAPIPLEDVLAAAEATGLEISDVTLYNDSTAPVVVGGGRGAESIFVNAYTGEVLGPVSPDIRHTMTTLMRWHRWFDVSRDNRGRARFVTGVSNLAFLFLIVTGVYLWLPKVMRWPLFRARLFFASHYKNAKQRDFHWHHVFGFWSALPLALIVASALLFSFSWARTVVEKIAGEDPPSRGQESMERAEEPIVARHQWLPIDSLVARAISDFEEWRTIKLELPDDGAQKIAFEVDWGSGRQPQKQVTVLLNALSGDIVDIERFADRSPAHRARAWLRFLHTGEFYGVVGQTIAGAVSLFSLFMVWTGFALAWRRLRASLLSRNSSA